MRNRNTLSLLLGALLVLVLLAFGGTGVLGQLTQNTTPGGTSSAEAPPSTLTSSVPAPPVSQAAPPEASARGNPSDLSEVRESELPAEGRGTLALIRAGGPFRYSQDGQPFGNFERILPRKDRGYYREYTVPTPDESDRGARRIVAGNGGEKYYTDDHYGTFRFIAEGS
ncbi:ribonuclease T1 [Pseudarthrobacter siccitolerans]|uniref:Ribonuclease T1 n=1 Tax=Pseudarthrobacter siccitolerans TaxID=861266 RepID=A0ABU0PPG8_9MICC|nr:ribonuclease domain-containing protein [Pseudarthrobacter siccitolerans]MDQ0675843.1 ribonuclease T1 [Pseudarthrobacter siccitolerans]